MDIYTVWTIMTFAVNYSQFTCAHLFQNIFIFCSKPHCFSTRRLWMKRSNHRGEITIYSHKNSLFTSTDEELRHLMHLTREETQIPKGCHLFGSPSIMFFSVTLYCRQDTVASFGKFSKTWPVVWFCSLLFISV